MAPTVRGCHDSLVPLREMDHREHDSRLLCVIRLAGMPQPQVPHYHTPLCHIRLRRRPHLDPLTQQPLLDPPARSIPMLTLLRLEARVQVRTEPDLCAPVLRGHGYKGDVDHESKGTSWMLEVGVGVDGLGLRGGAGDGGVAGEEVEAGAGAEDRGAYLGD